MSTRPSVEQPAVAPRIPSVRWLGHQLTNLARQPLFANAGYLWAVNLVNALGGFLFWGLAARLYPPEEVGLASAIISAVTLLASIAALGIGVGLIRFLPEARQPGRLLNTAFTFNVLAALLVGGLYLAGIRQWSPSLAGLRGNALYVAGFLAFTVATTLLVVTQMAFVAHRRAGYALAQAGIVNGGRLLLMAGLAGMGAMGLASSVALITLMAAALSLVVFLPHVKTGFRPRPDLLWRELAAILPYSAGNYLARLLAQVPQNLLPLLTLELLGPAAGGYAYVAWMVGSALTGPGLSLADSALAEGSHAPGTLKAVLWRSTRTGMALTGAGALVAGLVAPWLLRLFGAEYAAEATTLLRWLVAAAPLAVLAGLYFTRLRVEKRIGWLILLSAATAALTLGLAAALMPRYGIAASAVGWLLGNGLVAALAVVGMWRERRRSESLRH